MDESRREALGRFLRLRREELMPEEVGIASRRGRRTPGLRREEVAFLADIGVKWYARLECGDDIHPSAQTLTGVAAALRLSHAEVEYMLELAGLGSSQSETPSAVPAHFQALVREARGVGVTITDRILTPLFWNDLSEGLYGHSRFKFPVERNGLVRSVLDPEMIAFLGGDCEEFVTRAAGILRLNQTSPSRSPFADEVYEMVKDVPRFHLAWERRTVADDEPQHDVLTRNHAEMGRLVMFGNTFALTTRNDVVLRLMIPADEVTATKFRQLENAGAQSPVPGASLRVCN